MKLVIVESPNKVRKIREFLGAGFRVAASFGHVRDLPAKGGLGVAFENGKIIPAYVMLERSAPHIAELAGLVKQSSEIILATDPDREGEAIAWHVSRLLGEHAYSRVVFHAVTKEAVQKAMTEPRPLDQRLVDAQQARRVLDRVVGWLVSPTLRSISKEARSAGRVQSVALRLAAEREKEIQKHSIVNYFILCAKLEKGGAPPPFSAKLIAWKSRPLAQRLSDPIVAEKTVDWCKKQKWLVLSCERRDAARNAPPPFTTATIQQAASVRLGLNPDVTMKLLQSLFEDGRITYHRTDSRALAPESTKEARDVIAEDFPPEYLPKAPIIHAAKSANAQEAHEAIRPTHPESGAQALGGGDLGKLYRLIWQRFISCQMSSGRDQITTLDVACAPGAWKNAEGALEPMGVFQAKGKVTLFDGWRRLAGEDATEEAKRKGKKGADDAADDEENNIELPLLDAGDELDLLSLAALKRATKPPPRYTQASLIKKLEHEGIGRPSTYAAIMRVILERGYVTEEKRKLSATPLGISVTDFLIRHYTGSFIDLDYTRRLEDDLDRIARGEADWEKVVTAASFGVLALARRAGLWYDPLAKP
ncbi:MAG: DNA topoisomerase I [Elusimicrobia bacterium GWC2_65_9]|nr:MAG: DNA topoisomerase I [Elusimicrobia bacterium GWA2_66_18]OGR77571.1 MAG: DNA topoisomerase I [Elusimicrobia bacterium GWC2_65_9]